MRVFVLSDSAPTWSGTRNSASDKKGDGYMQGILLILALAVTVEAVVEYVKSIVKMFTEKDYRTAITQLSAAAIAIALCFAAGADLYAALGLRFAAPWIGAALTGLFASRGANYVSDLIGKLQALGQKQG